MGEVKEFNVYDKTEFINKLDWKKCDVLTLEKAIELCCPYPMELIVSKTKKSEVVAWRGAICVGRYLNNYTQVEASMSVNRDHATLIHYLKNIERELFTCDFRIVGNIRELSYYIAKGGKVKCNECKFELN